MRMEQQVHGLSGCSQNINVTTSELPSGYDFWHDASLSHREHVDFLISSTFANVECTNNATLDHQPNENANENDVRTHSSSSGCGAPTVSRRRKKPKGFPKRPLSGYNIFFKEERVKVLEESNSQRVATPNDYEKAIGRKIDRSSVSFQDLGKIIGKRWKTLSDEDRRRFESLADQDNLRYRSEMDDYNDAKRKRNEEKSLQTIVDDCDETPTSTNSNSKSKWKTMELTHLSDLYTPSFSQLNIPVIQLRTDDDPTKAQNWQSAQNPQHDSSNARSEQVFSYPIPPGTEITLPDHQGVDRPYQVQYNFFKMTRRDAEVYMAQLAQTPSVTPYGFTDFPPPPPGATYIHNPQWL
jgi:hypothetical protein